MASSSLVADRSFSNPACGAGFQSEGNVYHQLKLLLNHQSREQLRMPRPPPHYRSLRFAVHSYRTHAGEASFDETKNQQGEQRDHDGNEQRARWIGG